MPTRNYLGIVALLIAFGSILVSIAISPWFDWAVHDLSHLGIYENGLAAALIFNGGLIVTGVIMVIFLFDYAHRIGDPSSRLMLLPFVMAMVSLTLVGLFPAGSSPIHFLASLGFLLSFPVAMCIVGISWVRFQNRMVFAVASMVVGSSLILMWMAYLLGTSFFVGAAIPETLTAVTAAIWLWLAWARFRTVET